MSSSPQYTGGSPSHHTRMTSFEAISRLTVSKHPQRFTTEKSRQTIRHHPFSGRILLRAFFCVSTPTSRLDHMRFVIRFNQPARAFPDGTAFLGHTQPVAHSLQKRANFTKILLQLSVGVICLNIYQDTGTNLHRPRLPHCARTGKNTVTKPAILWPDLLLLGSSFAWSLVALRADHQVHRSKRRRPR